MCVFEGARGAHPLVPHSVQLINGAQFGTIVCPEMASTKMSNAIEFPASALCVLYYTCFDSQNKYLIARKVERMGERERERENHA